MQCGPHQSGVSAPVTPGLLAAAAAVPRVVANPARTKEAPLGPLELGEICPNCIFGECSAINDAHPDLS